MEWKEMSNKEEEKVWKLISKKLKLNYKKFEFKIRNNEVINQIYSMRSFENYKEYLNNIEKYKKELHLLIKEIVINGGDEIFAIELNGPSFKIDFNKNTSNIEWEIDPFPNGEFSIFISSNYEWGLIVNPVTKEVNIFGIKLVNNPKKNIFEYINQK